MRKTNYPPGRAFDPDVDPDSMIFSALSWYSVVHKLEQNLPKWTAESPHLYNGILTANPILLPFAVETALKAWYWRDHKKAPPMKHHLLPLFDSLNPTSQDLLNQRISTLQLCLKNQPDTPKNLHKTSLRETLSLHNDTFVLWRYPTHYKLSHIKVPSLRLALAVISDSYEKNFAIPQAKLYGDDCQICGLPSGQHSYRLY